MSEREFFTSDAKTKTAATIKEVEAETSAEVVVAVRHRAGDYRGADYLFGAILALLALVVLLFAPQSFAIETMPFDVILAFVVGAYLCSKLPVVARLVTTAKGRRVGLHQAACAAFVDLGIGRTRGRNGILVFASMLERTVEVVPDVGIDAKVLGEPWVKARAELETSLRPKPDLARFLSALRALGPALAPTMPHRPDDVNELPDEVA